MSCAGTLRRNTRARYKPWIHRALVCTRGIGPLVERSASRRAPYDSGTRERCTRARIQKIKHPRQERERERGIEFPRDTAQETFDTPKTTVDLKTNVGLTKKLASTGI